LPTGQGALTGRPKATGKGPVWGTQEGRVRNAAGEDFFPRAIRSPKSWRFFPHVARITSLTRTPRSEGPPFRRPSAGHRPLRAYFRRILAGKPFQTAVRPIGETEISPPTHRGVRLRQAETTFFSQYFTVHLRAEADGTKPFRLLGVPSDAVIVEPGALHRKLLMPRQAHPTLHRRRLDRISLSTSDTVIETFDGCRDSFLHAMRRGVSAASF